MEKTLNKNQTEALMRGEYSASDAKEIIFNLIKQKINFHNFRNFSSQERFGKPDEESVQRMEELRKSREQMLELINTAKKEGKTVRLKSNISIELI
ncbi:hypothetical protein [Marivirga sp.]|uniref:hypothetical protein n=1 Tax=Marivirga sp. TaxID=2018662 RepID=UPI002D80F2BB|nr:hypothetical protein [Marivirga sp.]HET8861422.1 hypothetical protein [Marivirga sp.]